MQNCGECLQHQMIGKKFGRLTVLKKGKKDKYGHVYWICQCDCGNIKEVSGYHLRAGNIQSCGCLLYEKITQPRPYAINDLTGQRFGKLVAISYKIVNRHAKWKCKCDCGNEIEVYSSNLITNQTKSCGCLRGSLGEKNIIDILNNANIPYLYNQCYFKDLNVGNGIGRFDFILYPNSDKIRLIEFDGIQHFKTQNSGWDTKEQLELTQKRDKIKNEYALSHHIPLVRIPYWERDNITLEMLLSDKYLVKAKEVAE